MIAIAGGNLNFFVVFVEGIGRVTLYNVLGVTMMMISTFSFLFVSYIFLPL